VAKPVIDEEQLRRSYYWYCLTCTDFSLYHIDTNTTAIRHIERNPTHVVLGVGTMVSRFTTDKPGIEDVELPPMPDSDPYTASPE
jgi:hypothetical protein